MIDVFELLKEHLCMDRKEAEDYFTITVTPTEYVLKPFRHLEYNLYTATEKLAREYGGDYDKSAKLFHIPKEQTETPLGVTTESIPNPSNETEDYALARSLKGKLGQLVPCLEDANGIVFDGLHRKKIDPNALTVKLDKVKTPMDRAEARMIANFCRRDYTPEEMRNDVGLMIGGGLTAQQISDETGVSLSTVYKYMPQEKKDQVKVEAGRLGGISAPSSEQTVKTQEAIQQTPAFQQTYQEFTEQVQSCEKCGNQVHRTKMTMIHNQLLCPKCAGKTEPKKTPEFTKLPAMPKQTWEDVKARMSPQHSNMETALMLKLHKEGVNVVTDFDFCLSKTTPDFWFPNKRLAVYLDGPVHIGKEDRDESLRDLLRKRHGITVVSIPYTYDTDTERERIFGLIMEAQKT